MFSHNRIPERLRGSYSDWLTRRKAKALVTSTEGYQDDQRRQELRQQLERELAPILKRLEVFSNQAITAAAKGEEFYPLLDELITRLQDIAQEQAKGKQKGRRLADMVREKMAKGQADDFTRQLALIRTRPVTPARRAGARVKGKPRGKLAQMVRERMGRAA